MKTSEALRAAMALIEDESGWCRGYYAWPARGRIERWCAQGAIYSVDRDSSTGASSALDNVCCDLHKGCSEYVNDCLGHAAVMECYREAIRRAEAEEAR